MAQDEFIALIEGRADLKNARDAFNKFKQDVEKPIKITIDASGFNAVWGNIQKQAQQAGVQTAQAYNKAFSKNMGGRSTIDAKLGIVTGELQQSGVFKEPALKELRATKELYSSIGKELDSIEKKGLKLRSISFDEGGNTFTAKAINDMNTLVTLTGYWKDEVRDAEGNLKEGAGWRTAIQYTTDYTSAIKQAQSEADKLAQSFNKIQDSFKNGTFSSAFDANIKRMESNLATLSANAFNSENTKKAVDAAAEYQRIMLEIQATLNGTAQNPLTDEQVVAKYQKAQAVLRQYADVWKTVRIEQGETISQEQANKNADGVQAWCNRNSKALKKYGKELEEIQEKMRHTFDANEQKALQQQAQQVYKSAGADGLTGLSFADQVKKAFNKIGQFTWIYAVTSQIKQVPQEMVQEVIKIDTAMTELRKVSTASASEIRDYFDQATESAAKYGQTINEVIDSTASWTRLGYNLDDAKVLSDASAELALVGSGLNLDSATEGIQAILRGFQMSADSAKQIGDIVNEVGDTSPIDQVGLIQGLERASAVLHETNNTLSESAGLITATTSVTQDATSAGTAWRTVALRITAAKQQLEEAGLDTDGMVESTATLRDYMMQVAGVDILDSTGKNFKSTYKIMEELSQVWDKLSGLEKSGILDKIAGLRKPVRTEMCA